MVISINKSLIPFIVTIIVFVICPPLIRAQDSKACLDKLKIRQNSSLEFDLKFDRNAEGDYFSCDVLVRPSYALSVLEDFRYGFLYDSKPHFMRAILFPLTITIAGDEKNSKEQEVKINNFDSWMEFKKTHFSQYERAMIACASLNNVHIHQKYSAFTIGFGRVWFYNTVNHGLKVNEINIRPMDRDLFVKSCISEE
jgi:hypothetical protein